MTTENCEKARKLADAYKYVNVQNSQTAVDVIDACCGKGSDTCIEKLAAMAGEVYCMEQTGGSCQPCCAFISSKAAQVLMFVLDQTGLGGLIGGYWNLGSAIINSIIPAGSCDFSPDFNNALNKGKEVGRAKALSLNETWIDIQLRAGVPIPPGARENQQVLIKCPKNTVVFWAVPFNEKQDPNYIYEIVTWENLLTNRAAWQKMSNELPFRYYGDLMITADTSWGMMQAPPMDKASRHIGMDQYFYATYKHFKCDRQAQFIDSLTRLLTYKLDGIEKAYSALQVDMARQMAKMQPDILQPNILSKFKLSPLSPKLVEIQIKKTFLDPLVIQRIRAANARKANAEKTKIAAALAIAAGISAYLLWRRRQGTL